MVEAREPRITDLMVGFLGDVPYHVVVAECEDQLSVITTTSLRRIDG